MLSNGLRKVTDGGAVSFSPFDRSTTSLSPPTAHSGSGRGVALHVYDVRLQFPSLAIAVYAMSGDE